MNAAEKKVFTELVGQTANLSVQKILILFFDRNFNTAAVMGQLLFWSQKIKRQDGFFFKSQAELAEELCLSRDQVAREIRKIKNKLGDAMETKLVKAKGVPTTHFKLDLDVVIRLISDFNVERSADDSTAINNEADSAVRDNPTGLGEVTQPAGRGNPTAGLGEVAQPLTDPKHIRTTDPIPTQQNGKTSLPAEQARPVTQILSPDENRIVEIWNALGCARHKGITKNARKAIEKTYREYRKGNKTPKDLTEWVTTYLKHGFALWMTDHHRNKGDGKWCADLEFAMRFSTYDKVRNAELAA